jgi:hypothetical protein
MLGEVEGKKASMELTVKQEKGEMQLARYKNATTKIRRHDHSAGGGLPGAEPG